MGSRRARGSPRSGHRDLAGSSGWSSFLGNKGEQDAPRYRGLRKLGLEISANRLGSARRTETGASIASCGMDERSRHRALGKSPPNRTNAIQISSECPDRIPSSDRPGLAGASRLGNLDRVSQRQKRHRRAGYAGHALFRAQPGSAPGEAAYPDRSGRGRDIQKRQGQHNKRMRGRNRKGPNPLTRSFESNGGDVKIRGTALHIAEKYVQLSRDAHRRATAWPPRTISSTPSITTASSPPRRRRCRSRSRSFAPTSEGDEEDEPIAIRSNNNNAYGDRPQVAQTPQPAFGLADPAALRERQRPGADGGRDSSGRRRRRK